MNETIKIPIPTRTGVRSLPHNYPYPTNIVFQTNSGGEFRKSYHGYPNGYAQLIHSPTQWVIEAMQIDTHNRKYNINDPVGYKPFFIPHIQKNRMTELNNKLSPLIECPCSDRITKITYETSNILTDGKCVKPIINIIECKKSIEKNDKN